MSRRSNQFKSAVYTRMHWLTEVYGRIKGQREAEIPLPPLALPSVELPRARVALLTSAGVHLSSQEPFDMANRDGDASVRLLPGDVETAALTITHDYYDHHAADQDINCVFPIDRLRELTQSGDVGEVAPRHVGFMGHILGPEWTRLVGDTAPAVAELFRQDSVDAVVASPG